MAAVVQQQQMELHQAQMQYAQYSAMMVGLTALLFASSGDGAHFIFFRDFVKKPTETD
jgi:hypothetical protein